MPIVTVGKDFADADRELRKTFVAADEYGVGEKLADLLRERKPSGGTVCLQAGAPDNEAAKARLAGFRDTIGGGKDIASLNGQNNWHEASNCPIIDDGTAEVANKAIAAVLASNPYLDALVLAAGEGPNAAQGYAKAVAQAADRLKSGSLVIIGAAAPAQVDAIKAGRIQAQVGQRADQVGRTIPDLLLMLAKDQKVPDPFYAGVETCTAATLATCPKK
jgi:ribose transport system substrate-binding protein